MFKHLLPPYKSQIHRMLALTVCCLIFAACAEEPSKGKTSIAPTAENRLEPILKPSQSPSPVPTLEATQEAILQPTLEHILDPTPSPEAAGEPVSTMTADIAVPSIEKWPEDYNPLTGEMVADPADLQRRPIAVKLSNISRVRPQAGLSKADIVFEHLTEGGITRFTAIFYTHDAQKVGSIRSGRLIDLEIPLMLDAAFAYSGSSIQIKMMIEDSVFFDRVVSPDFGNGGFYRDSSVSTGGRFLEDTMFTDTRVVRAALQERGEDNRPVFHSLPLFQSEIPEGGAAVKSVEVAYLGTSAHWYYDKGFGRFLRWSDGVRHVDATTDQQLAFDNIIIVQANHVNTEIIEDTGGSPSIQIQLWGTGPVSIFRDGYRYDGIWRRDYPFEMLTFYNESGSPLYLSPGTSFYQIVPLNYQRIYVETD